MLILVIWSEIVVCLSDMLLRVLIKLKWGLRILVIRGIFIRIWVYVYLLSPRLLTIGPSFLIIQPTISIRSQPILTESTTTMIPASVTNAPLATPTTTMPANYHVPVTLLIPSTQPILSTPSTLPHPSIVLIL